MLVLRQFSNLNIKAGAYLTIKAGISLTVKAGIYLTIKAGVYLIELRQVLHEREYDADCNHSS